jgi:uncharacterized membrane protein YhfC
MISGSVMAWLYICLAATLVFPVVFLVVMCWKKKLSVKPVLLGLAAFFVSQVCIRLPILQAISTTGWFLAFAENTVPYAIVLAFTAGLFEETARLVCARFFLKKQRSFRDAVSFGLGHGFCEVVLIVGLTQVNNLIYAVMINSGTFQAATAALPPSSSKAILSAMLAVTPTVLFVSIWERVSAVLFHLFESVLIFRGVNEHKAGLYYVLAVAAHTVIDASSVLVSKYGGMWLSEAVIFVMALVGIFYVLKTRDSFRKSAPAQTAA